MSKTRRIEVLSGVPSSGKTYTIRHEEIIPHLDKEDHPGFLHIYVAPTHNLCTEVFKNIIESRVVNDGVLYLDSTYSNPSLVYANLLGMNKNEKEATERMFRENIRVVICTHECFYRAPLKASRIAARASVFFDEARDCVFTEELVNVSNASVKNLLNAFKLDRFTEDENIKVKNQDYVSRVYRLRSEGFPETRELLKKFKVRDTRDLPTDVSRIYALKEKMHEGRAELIIGTEFKRGEEFGCMSHVIGIASPARMFEGYGRVVIMSAYFEHSQMYSILAHGHVHSDVERVQFVDYEPVRYAVARLFRHRNAMMTEKAYKQIYIGALLTGDTKTITSTMLSSGLLVNRKVNALLRKAQCKVKKNVLVSRLFDEEATLVQADFPGLSKEEFQYLRKALKQCANPPLLVLHAISYGVFAKLGIKKALCFVNSRNSASLAGKYFVGNGKAKVLLMNVANFLGNLKAQLEDTDLPLTEKMLENLHKIVKKKMFTYPSLVSHGVNTYSDYPAFTHIAAVNMRPHTARLLCRVFPGYDPELDKVITNIIQNGFRGLVRVRDNTDPYYFLVGTEHIISQVERLCFAGKKLQRIPEHEPRFEVLDYVSIDKEAKARAGRIGGKNRRKYTPEVAKLVQKAQISLRKAKTEKTREKWRNKLEKLQK